MGWEEEAIKRARKRWGPNLGFYSQTKGRKKYLGWRGKYRRAGFYGGIEKKFRDVSMAGTIASAGTVLSTGTLLGISQGTSEIQRIGNTIMVVSMQMQGHLRLPPTTVETDTYEEVKMIVYLDKQCNGATATIAQMWEGTNTHDFNNLENRKRFRVLAKRYFSLKSTGGGGATGADNWAGDMKQFSWFKKFKKPIEIEYSGSGAAITDIRSNNIGVMLISNKGLAVLNGRIRIRYTDR